MRHSCGKQAALIWRQGTLRARGTGWGRMAFCLSLCLCTLLLGTSTASAQASRRAGGYFPTYGAGLKLGFYRPVISPDPRVNQVRDKLSNNRAYVKHPLLYQLEGEYYLLRSMGLLGIYGRAGLWSDSSKALLCKEGDEVVRCSAQTALTQGQPGLDNASMTIVPLSLGLAYRFDTLRRNYDFPLVLGARTGLDYDLWWSSVGRKRSVVLGEGGRQAKGGNLGFSASVSVGLALDYFTRSYRRYGSDVSGQTSYLFVEYAYMYGKSLFSKKPLIDLSDHSVANIGIAIDFH